MDAYQKHLDSLTDSARLTRRGFAITGLAAGFAVSVCPVSAATITTDATGLIAGEIKIPVSDGTIPGYRAMPAKGTHHPVILVIQEIFGVHEHIRDICRRLAKLGYYAIAGELYAREGSLNNVTAAKDILEFLSKVPNAQVMTDIDATVAFAKAEKADTVKLGVAGFCWGGSRAWLYPAHNPQVKAGVAWYGPVIPRPDTPVTGDPTPIDVADKIKGRVLGLYAGKDAGIPADSLTQMQAALKAAGDMKSRIIVFPEAEHGFNADYRPSYNEAAAKEGWADMLAWFKSHGVA